MSKKFLGDEGSSCTRAFDGYHARKGNQHVEERALFHDKANASLGRLHCRYCWVNWLLRKNSQAVPQILPAGHRSQSRSGAGRTGVRGA